MVLTYLIPVPLTISTVIPYKPCHAVIIILLCGGMYVVSQYIFGQNEKHNSVRMIMRGGGMKYGATIAIVQTHILT